MRKKAIVVDIDNTILSQAPRKKIIIKELFNIDVTVASIEEDFELESVLSDVAEKCSKDND